MKITLKEWLYILFLVDSNVPTTVLENIIEKHGGIYVS